MDEALKAVAAVLKDHGLAGLVIGALSYALWRTVWLWINEAQVRAKADLEQAEAQRKNADAMNGLTTAVQQIRDLLTRGRK